MHITANESPLEQLGNRIEEIRNTLASPYPVSKENLACIKAELRRLNDEYIQISARALQARTEEHLSYLPTN